MSYRSPSGLGHQRPQFQPQCTHITMTRLYGDHFICESCHQPGVFGWLYRCTQDREEMIEQAVSRGFTAAFDKIGQEFAEELTIRKGSPASRSDRLSFLDEITPEQMRQYHPQQLSKVLRQREQAQAVAYRERLRKNSAFPLPPLSRFRESEVASPHGGVDFPWVCRSDEECQYKICPCCRPACADRAYMSLNAVANGEVLPTAAAGFGFHIVNRRPVADVDVVRNLGLRKAPKSRTPESSYTDSTFASELSMMDILDDQIAQSCHMWRNRSEAPDTSHGAMESVLHKSPGRLRHSPGCDNLNRAALDESREVAAQGPLERAPWTPPPSPNQQEKEKSRDLFAPGHATEAVLETSRSSMSLNATPSVRKQLLTSISTSSALTRMQKPMHSTATNRQAPDLDETEYDIGLMPPCGREAFDNARNTPLAPQDVPEETLLQGHLSSMMEDEQREGRFQPAPLKVDHGVAVLEESVELGVPNVVTQV